MAVIRNTVPIAPASSLNSSILQIPPLSSQQVLKYICDFSISNGGFLIDYVLNPANSRTFGCARMMRIDARNLLLPVTVSISDSLSDSITVMPGDYDMYHLDGLPSDTYTVTGFDAFDNNQSGYLKIYLYNYIDIDVMKKREGRSYQLSSVCNPTVQPLFSIPPPPIGGGMPIIESIDVYTGMGNAAGSTFLKLTPNILITQAWLGPNPWTFYYQANGSILTYNTRPNCVLPPFNTAVVPANDNLPEIYVWQLTPSITGTTVTGDTTFLLTYRFN